MSVAVLCVKVKNWLAWNIRKELLVKFCAFLVPLYVIRKNVENSYFLKNMQKQQTESCLFEIDIWEYW